MGTAFSKSRLARLHAVLAGYVERGAVPGVVALLARHGETHVETIGGKTLGGGDPIRRDTIFRIASITKPITAAAAMILVEECRLRLDDPVDRLLPELAGRRVLKRLDGPLDDIEPAKRPITLRDLLTFRLGFGILMVPPGTYPIQRAASELDLGQGMPQPQTPPAPDEWLRRFGTLPLMHQPGEKWVYNTGSDVLGVLIARAFGQPFRRSCTSACSSRSAWPTPVSACRRRSSTALRTAIGPAPRPARSRSTTKRLAANGVARPRSHRAAAVWSRRWTITFLCSDAAEPR